MLVCLCVTCSTYGGVYMGGVDLDAGGAPLKDLIWPTNADI